MNFGYTLEDCCLRTVLSHDLYHSHLLLNFTILLSSSSPPTPSGTTTTNRPAIQNGRFDTSSLPSQLPGLERRREYSTTSPRLRGGCGHPVDDHQPGCLSADQKLAGCVASSEARALLVRPALAWQRPLGSAASAGHDCGHSHCKLSGRSWMVLRIGMLNNFEVTSPAAPPPSCPSEPSPSGVAHPAPPSSRPSAPTRRSRSVPLLRALSFAALGFSLFALRRWMRAKPEPTLPSPGVVVVKPLHPGITYLSPPGPPKTYVKVELPIDWERSLLAKASRREHRPSAPSPVEESAFADSPQ